MKLKNSLLVAAALLATPAIADTTSPDAPQPREGTIVETAASVKDFSTLVAAVKAAGLVDALHSEGPFTVFAPTNEAFERLPKGTVDFLLQRCAGNFSSGGSGVGGDVGGDLTKRRRCGC